MKHFVETDIYIKVLAYLDTSYRILWKYSKMGHFPTWNITCFKRFGVVQHKLGKITLTNETFCENRHIYLGFSIF